MIAALITFASMLVIAMGVAFIVGIGADDAIPQKVSMEDEAEILSRDYDEDE